MSGSAPNLFDEVTVEPLDAARLDACVGLAALAPDPWGRDAFEKTLFDENRLCLVALAGGVAVGFAAFFRVGPDADSADLEQIVVAAGARRHGVAQRLLAAGQAALARRGARRLLLEVRCSNTAAIALYQKAGFATLAKRPGMYAHPREDGLLMGKALTKRTANQ